VFPLLGLLAAGVLVEVRPGTADGISPDEHAQALQVVLERLSARGNETCANLRGSELTLSAPTCDGQSPDHVLTVGLFVGISQVRWLLIRQTPGGREVSQTQVDLRKGAAPDEPIAAGLDRLLPRITAKLPPPPPLVPITPVAEPETPAWVPVVGVGAVVAAVAGSVFVGSALVARGSVGEPAQDPQELEDLESRRVTHGTIGALLIGLGIGAAIAYATAD
jgi:hypothetical protein